MLSYSLFEKLINTLSITVLAPPLLIKIEIKGEMLMKTIKEYFTQLFILLNKLWLWVRTGGRKVLS